MSPPVAGDLAGCSIVAASGLAQARVTARSFRRHHPDLPFVVLVAGAGASFDLSAEPFETVSLDELRLPQRARFLFVHRRDELLPALTPFFFEHLFERGFDRLLYLKQETMVVGNLGPLLARISGGRIVLTPHLTAPLAGPRAVDRELLVLLSGAFNAGVIGLADGADCRRFLAWWGARLATGCRHEVAAGWHYEQRWLDLAPSFLPEVAIERNPGFNCGHWALPERRILGSGGGFEVDGSPLCIFRFSGYDADRPDFATRYFDRLRVAELGDAAALFEEFRRELLASGHAEVRDIPWRFGAFDDGTPIPDVAREMLRELGDAASRFGDPFSVAGSASYFAWLNEPVDGAGFPTRLWSAVYRRRPDVQAAFPDPHGAQRNAFAAWARASGLAEHGIDERFLRDAPA